MSYLARAGQAGDLNVYALTPDASTREYFASLEAFDGHRAVYPEPFDPDFHPFSMSHACRGGLLTSLKSMMGCAERDYRSGRFG